MSRISFTYKGCAMICGLSTIGFACFGNAGGAIGIGFIAFLFWCAQMAEEHWK